MSDEMLDILYDAVKRKIDTGWFIEVDGEDYFFPESQCELHEQGSFIKCPGWLVRKKGLELYVV